MCLRFTIKLAISIKFLSFFICYPASVRWILRYCRIFHESGRPYVEAGACCGLADASAVNLPVIKSSRYWRGVVFSFTIALLSVLVGVCGRERVKSLKTCWFGFVCVVRDLVVDVR